MTTDDTSNHFVIYPSWHRPGDSLTLSREFSKYLHQIQKNQRIVSPRDAADAHSLSSNINHGQAYALIYSKSQLENLLTSGYPHPMIIPPGSPLGKSIRSRSTCFSKSFAQLKEEIIDTNSEYSVQLFSHKNLEQCATVQNGAEAKRRMLDPDIRGDSAQQGQNLLDVRDNLPGSKCPEILDDGGYLLKWQRKVPTAPSQLVSAGRSRTQPRAGPSASGNRSLLNTAVEGAKELHKWLLVSERQAGSWAHQDAAFGTFIACVQGSKVLFLQDLQQGEVDRRVWAKLLERNVRGDFDHQDFQKPWDRLTLGRGWTVVMPPGIAHAVYTPEDTICAGGHFVLPAYMDRVLDVVRQVEDSSWTRATRMTTSASTFFV